MVDNLITMWCDHCQRDVPIVRQPEGGLLCPQCGAYRASGDAAAVALAQSAVLKPPAGDPTAIPGVADAERQRSAPTLQFSHDTDSFAFSGQDAWWELEARLRDLRFALDAVMPPEETAGQDAVRKARHDFAHEDVAASHWKRPGRQQAADTPDDHWDRGESPMVFWGALALGLMSFVCGGILLGWSFVLKTAILGLYGVPITVVGLGFLLVAVLFRPRPVVSRKPQYLPGQRRKAGRSLRKSLNPVCDG